MQQLVRCQCGRIAGTVYAHRTERETLPAKAEARAAELTAACGCGKPETPKPPTSPKSETKQ